MKCKSYVRAATFIPVLLLFINSITCMAQGEILLVRVTPQSFIHPSIPSLLAGEYKPLQHWSVSADIGVRTPSVLFQWNNGFDHLTYWRMKSELRWYPKGYTGF